MSLPNAKPSAQGSIGKLKSGVSTKPIKRAKVKHAERWTQEEIDAFMKPRPKESKLTWRSRTKLLRTQLDAMVAPKYVEKRKLKVAMRQAKSNKRRLYVDIADVPNKFLQYLFPVTQYTCIKHQIDPNDFMYCLFLYKYPPQFRRQFQAKARLCMVSGQNPFARFYESGLIRDFKLEKTSENRRLYVLSYEVEKIIDEFYKKVGKFVNYTEEGYKKTHLLPEPLTVFDWLKDMSDEVTSLVSGHKPFEPIMYRNEIEVETSDVDPTVIKRKYVRKPK